MSHPLTGCLLKLDRAGTHLKALKDAIEGFLNPDRDRLPGEFKADEVEYEFRAKREMHPRTDWSLIAGDVVHNISAALDYLAWELTPPAKRVGRETRISFPIFEDPAKYGTQAPDKIRGMPTQAQAFIKRLQPFATQHLYHPSEHPLALLYRLEQRDKHRALNLTTFSASVRVDGLIHRYSPGPYDFHWGPHEKGTILCRVKGIAGPKMGVYLEVAHQVTFDKDGPAPTRNVLQTLSAIKRHVDAIVPQFMQFFR